MALVTHKYMVDRMPEDELRATFAAREHTLDYLVREIRKQSGAGTLTSYLITGPRGAGKTTIVRMLCLRIADDPELAAAWLPVRLTEELPGVTSLRDVLTAVLEQLAEDGVAGASAARAAVEAVADDDDAERAAIDGLLRISREQGKRLLAIVENLDQVFDRAIEDHSAATLRRLLMVEPFMMLVGTALSQFEALQRYDQAFFNYFCPVPLDRLNDAQVHALLESRAAFEGNAGFAEQYRRHRPKIQAITRLTGGNPRLVMMLYEVVSQGDLPSVVATLNKLLDDLTPLLKQVLEHQLPRQQAKLVDALMRAGGTATPASLAAATRISLSSVTSQLKRLKDLQLVEVLGGGKGREAHYTIPDPLFSTWYQMRYLRPQRRRIELFVEFLRIWFDDADRLATLQTLTLRSGDLSGRAQSEWCAAMEYFGASLARTPYAAQANELVIGGFLERGRIHDAAMVLADSEESVRGSAKGGKKSAYAALALWALERKDIDAALKVVRVASEHWPDDPLFQTQFAAVLGLSGDRRGALARLNQVIQSSTLDPAILAWALGNRGAIHGVSGNKEAEIADYTALLEMTEASASLKALALLQRGVAYGANGEKEKEIDDYTALLEITDAPAEQKAAALLNRGNAHRASGDAENAIADCTAFLAISDSPADRRATAFVNRGAACYQSGMHESAIADFTAVLAMANVSADKKAMALLGRGVVHVEEGDSTDAMHDLLAALRSSDVESDTRGLIALCAISATFVLEGKEGVDRAVCAFAQGSAGLLADQREMVTARVLRELAEQGSAELWIAAVRGFAAYSPDGAASVIEFFVPIADVLESGDLAKLDPLPPEQREFAREVLARFDRSEAAEPTSGEGHAGEAGRASARKSAESGQA